MSGRAGTMVLKLTLSFLLAVLLLERDILYFFPIDKNIFSAWFPKCLSGYSNAVNGRLSDYVDPNNY